MREGPDVVIVGAGVGGGALACVLARRGLAVLVLERMLVHQDRVRGEWMAPWGVAETQHLGLLDVLTAAGAHWTRRHLPYAEGVTPEEAEARCIDIAAVLPGVPGAINVGHPRLCEALDAAAQAAGATLLRGVTGLSVLPGTAPKVGFTVEGQRHEVAPRLVVGADGRGSHVARQIGARANTDPTHHIIGGLLVEGAEAWPGDHQAMGVHGSATLYVFPQADGRKRLYLCHALDDRGRFSGEAAARNFLAAFRAPSLPFGDALAEARPIGPYHGYPNEDTWIDVPVAPGAVLIGDAAGHNDPTTGQGLSITMRDVRLVAETILGGRWSADAFLPYAEERRERMRRLRFVARLVSRYNAEFTSEAQGRRRAVAQRLAADPDSVLPLLAIWKGPANVPAEAFGQAAWDRLLGS
jgi:2-polyprenyl-6-methoxyphenol hydroxylase-like FAD-dependent oxidoreductase